MTDSKVYTHPDFSYLDNIHSSRLVQWKDQVILVKWNKESIEIKNLDTKKTICELEFNTISDLKHFAYGVTSRDNSEKNAFMYSDFAYGVTSRDNSEKNAFMYSDSILWIGSVLNCWINYYQIKQQYVIWLIDLEKSACVKTWCPNLIDSIWPIGSKYFSIVKKESNEPLKNMDNVYAWSDLVEFDKPMVPVYQVKKSVDLYAVNWKSSSIEQLGTCELVLINSHENRMVFLDKNFNQILTLGISDLFPDYEPGSEPDSEKTIGKFNANCIVFYTIKKTIGIHNVYCWDFTANTQVKFSQNITNLFQSIINPSIIYPIRSSTGNVKFIVKNFSQKTNTSYYEIYEPE